ncbi:hypothetical protein RJ640_027749 [Escallonia rubra]|uniref:Uncharacterized protein n=1 Tax=Escallonia rubra TaxID=112253 RepID=A0AA88U1F3_9ASTE|nr:hypothetical protein RJ640_027749 [Escallonia rubra]
MSYNSFIFNFSSTWVPPFHVCNLDLGLCQLGHPFPAWLENQKELMYLDICNASILGSIPNWFWDLGANLSLFNVPHNQLGGQLPNPLPIAPFADIDFRSNLFGGGLPLLAVEVKLLDLSNNNFFGPIPQNIGESMPNLIFLSLSDNQLVGDIPSSIGEMLSLQVIDLSGNKLSENIKKFMLNKQELDEHLTKEMVAPTERQPLRDHVAYQKWNEKDRSTSYTLLSILQNDLIGQFDELPTCKAL